MDFNTFSDTDFNLPIVIKKPIEIFLTELHVLFGTSKGRIFCNRKFGQQLENYLWDTSYNTEYIQSQCELAVEENCSMTEFFNTDVTFKTIQGTSRDIGVLTIEIKDKETNYTIANPQWVFK